MEGIEYRFFDTGNKKMRYFNDDVDDIDNYREIWGELICNLGSAIFACEQEGILMKYLTKDKNGKKIHEGDIISIEGTKIADKITRVVILDGFSYWVSKDGTKENADMYFTKTIAESSTVIGNIYENKNLIKQIINA